MSVPQLISHHAEMARNNVDKYVEVYGREREGKYTKLGYSTEPTKMQYVKKFQEGGYGLWSPVNEGAEITTTGFTTDYETDFYWVKYGFGDERSYESYSTDVKGLTKKIRRKLAKAAFDSKESLSANQFNNATSTGAAYLGMDNVALVSASHPYTGGTWSNRGVDTGGSSNVDVDLSATTLEQALQKLMDTVNDQGSPDSREGPFWLYVPTALAGLAHRLTKEISPKLPGSTNNDGNWAGGMIDVLVNPWLTDDDAWFLVAKGEEDNGLFMLTHEGRLVEKDVNMRRQTVAILVTEKISFFCEDARGIWGSPGA